MAARPVSGRHATKASKAQLASAFTYRDGGAQLLRVSVDDDNRDAHVTILDDPEHQGILMNPRPMREFGRWLIEQADRLESD